MIGQVQNGRLYIGYKTSFTNTKTEQSKHLQTKSLHYFIVKHGTLKVVLAFLKVKLQGVYECCTYQTTSVILTTRKL